MQRLTQQIAKLNYQAGAQCLQLESRSVLRFQPTCQMTAAFKPLRSSQISFFIILIFLVGYGRTFLRMATIL